MSVVMENLGSFFVYALVAVFVQNAVFTRAFGVSRLTRLVRDSATDGMTFCAFLTLIQVMSAPLGYFLNQLLAAPQFWFRDYVRPLGFVLAALAAYGTVLLLLWLLKPKSWKELAAVLPMATLNVAVLGPMLISAAQSYTFVQTMGFALGSGLGYGFAVLVVTEGQRKMNSQKVPTAMRGLPINLIYIGILALAIYGFTGHMVAI